MIKKYFKIRIFIILDNYANTLCDVNQFTAQTSQKYIFIFFKSQREVIEEKIYK